jgi:hypothetical protein
MNPANSNDSVEAPMAMPYTPRVNAWIDDSTMWRLGWWEESGEVRVVGGEWGG